MDSRITASQRSMIRPREITVALVDPLWIGHHPMYFNQFAAAFLRCGARVIGLCPDPDAAMKNLLESPGVDVPADAKERVHFGRLEPGKRSFFNGRFEGDPVHTFSRWKRSADVLADAEAECGFTADLVYFPYLDSYLRFLPLPIIPDLLLGRPWSGLYIRNHHLGESPSLLNGMRMLAKGDALMKSKLCRGVGVLDERTIEPMSKVTRGTVTAYPDVTQAGMPEKTFPQTEIVKRKAAGRAVIGMIGLEPRKGLLTMIRTAELARAKKLPYYFAFLGTYHPSNYTDAQLTEINALHDGIARGEIDNVHFDPTSGRIREETDYNDVFSSFDIAWAAYEGFKGSSGTLSKAALFEIPCLATAGECVGQRVERYRIGLTISEGDAKRALEAIPLLLAGRDYSDQPLSPRYDAYRDDHSQERLDHILKEILSFL